MRKRLFRTLALMLTLGLVFPWASGAALHLRLERSAPADEAVLETPPEEIRLWFTQEPELAVSRIGLEGPAGKVELGEVERDEDAPEVLFASVPEPLPDGRYTVSWVTSSGDGHPVKGEFGFRIDTTARVR